jgi:Kef-type K+ transport system membrane component KefB/nucleotide-binding universal stress UspA family protein
MIILSGFDLTLPLKNPVLLFSLILFIILFAPLILNKLKIPHLIGLIIAGAIIGPNGLNLMLRDSSIVLYGTVGLLYIMFLAGLEIDMADFKKNSKKSLVFGLLTFSIPMTLGTLISKYFLEFSWMTSVLLASMFASHTLIAYPIVSKLGVAKNRAVNITVGGTVITDTLALLVLAAIAGMATGDADTAFWVRISISVIIFGLIVMFIFPIIARWFFKKFDDNISQYIFVLAMVFLGAFLAEAAGIEAIIGAFLVGLALNRLIPHTSPLMNRVEFVGNALFIPFFLIGVGMLIDYRVFFKDLETIKVAATMIVVATLAKFLAAWITQKIYGFNRNERRLIFGLSNAQAAATLAAVLVGFNIITSFQNTHFLDNFESKNGIVSTTNNQEILFSDGLKNRELRVGSKATVNGFPADGKFELSNKTQLVFQHGEIHEIRTPNRLLNESVLNGTILMILFTCTIASFVAQRGAQNIAMSESSEEEDESEESERILVSTNDLDTTEELVNLALTIKSKSNKTGLFSLTVVENVQSDSAALKSAKKIMNKAVVTASAADMPLRDLLRYDNNVGNCITNVVKEQKVSDLILGLHEPKGISDNFIGTLSEGILSKSNSTTFIYKPIQPISTIKRHLVFVPHRAEKEIGFLLWLSKLWNIARNTGASLVFYSSQSTLSFIEKINQTHPVECEFIEFEDWDDFLILSRDIKSNDSMFIVMSRKEHPSYHNQMAKVPGYMNKYFKSINYILVYPAQIGVNMYGASNLKNPSLVDSMEKLDELGKTIANLFKRK